MFVIHRKLTTKLLSSEASANDVNEARVNPLVCEPTVFKFKLLPQDYALVMMTDKVYQMYLKTGWYLHLSKSKKIRMLFFLFRYSRR